MMSAEIVELRPGIREEAEVERLSRELKAQMKRAKERISAQSCKLIEPRSFKPKN